MKKIIVMMQWIATFVSSVMNNVFLSPRVLGMENLFRLARMKEESGLGVIFISNHINANDPFVETAFFPDCLKEKIFPITFLASHEKFSNFVKSFFMKLLGCISVGGGNSGNAREIIRLVKSKESIFLFPEGMVSKTGELGKDHGALEKLVKISNVIVQPIRINGLKYFWDTENMLFRKRKLEIVFGQPVVLKKGTKVDAVEMIALLNPE